MEYKRVSADCHLDMPWMPPTLFTSESSNALKDRMPYADLSAFEQDPSLKSFGDLLTVGDLCKMVEHKLAGAGEAAPDDGGEAAADDGGEAAADDGGEADSIS